MAQTHLQPAIWYSDLWYETNPGRLLLEKKAMEERFPQFQLVRDGDQLVWVGTLTSNRDNTYEIALYYPGDFPAAAPKVYPINPAITSWKDQRTGELQHQWNDGSLCLYNPDDRTVNTNTTAATVMAIAAAWFFAYESWLESGKQDWPGVEAPHET
jgi:hypothetical protein